MTVSSCKLTLVLLVGSLYLITGCASTGELKDQHPRMQWAGEDRTQESPIVMGWAGEEKTEDRIQVYWAGPSVAVLPVYNLTAAPAPLKELEALLSDALKRRGVSVLEKNILEKFMARHRMRYVGGLDKITASAMKDEAGVEAVLVSTLEFFHEGDPPKISLHSRLVSTGPDPEIMWIDSACMAGDDSPGLLDLGIIHDSRYVMEITAERLARSLVQHLAGDSGGEDDDNFGGGIHPTDTYRSPVLELQDVFNVAVTPFLNLSERPRAGEILPLHFVDLLNRSGSFRVLEPGVVRNGLLQMRVTMKGGLSKPHLELVLRSVAADLVLTGTVFRYQDRKGPMGEPDVEFSIQVFERASKKVVWSSRSIGRGGDGVYFFGVGRRSTACELTAEQVSATIVEMTEKAFRQPTAINRERMIP